MSGGANVSFNTPIDRTGFLRLGLSSEVHLGVQDQLGCRVRRIENSKCEKFEARRDIEEGESFDWMNKVGEGGLRSKWNRPELVRVDS